jgi:hypothetical protein
MDQPPPPTQTATLTYLKRHPQFSKQQGLKPYRLIGVQPTPEVPVTNMQFEQYQVPMTDLRRLDQSSLRDTYTLENNGFQFFDWPISTANSRQVSTLHTHDNMRHYEDQGNDTISMKATYDQVKEYCKQMSDKLRDELGAEEVFLYEFRVSAFLFSNPYIHCYYVFELGWL